MSFYTQGALFLLKKKSSLINRRNKGTLKFQQQKIKKLFQSWSSLWNFISLRYFNRLTFKPVVELWLSAGYILTGSGTQCFAEEEEG